MTMDRDFEREVQRWVQEGPEQLPDANLDLALQDVARTPQRASGVPMPAYPMLRAAISVAAAVVVVAVAGMLAMTLLPGNDVGPTIPRATPTATPVPTATPLPTATPAPPGALRVVGDFEAVYGSAVIDARGDAGRVTGSLEITPGPGRRFSVALRCSTTDSEGVLLIGGRVTESANREVSAGDRVAIALQAGETPTSILWFEGRRRPGDCAAFLGRIPDLLEFLQPIDGELELSASPAEG